MRALITWTATGLFALLAIVPPLYLLVDALFVGGEFSLSNYRVVLLDSRRMELLMHSLLVGGLTCLFTFLLGVSFGYLLARVRIPFKTVFRCLYLVPVMIPTYIIGITWTEHFDLGGLSGIVILFTACYWPVVALFAEKGFRSVGCEMEEAALLSAGPLRARFFVTFRLASPSILVGLLLVFILTVGDFGIPDFLSFTYLESYQVYPLEIFNRWSVMEETGEAVASSLPIVAVAVLAVWVITRLEGKGGGAGITGAFRQAGEHPAGRFSIPAFVFMASIVAASTLLPLVTLVLWVSRAGGFHEVVGRMKEAFASAGGDALNSMLSAAVAAALMVLVGFFVAYRIERGKGAAGRILSFASLLPLAFPPVMLAVADIRIWNHPGNPLSDLVYGSQAELVMIYFARFVPIAILSIRAALKMVDPSLENASYMTGRCYPSTVARVLGPMVWGGICAAFFLAYIMCMRELDSVALISAGCDTLPQRIYSQVHTSRDAGIGAMSIILVFTLLVPPAVYRLLIKGRIDVI